VSPELRSGLQALAEALPTGAPLTITVPREALLALLAQEAPGAAPAESPRLLDADEVATRLGVEKQFVYRHKKSLGAVHVGRAVRFPERHVERYLARRSVTRLDPARC
jgi:excisionase family DNA binding protein